MEFETAPGDVFAPVAVVVAMLADIRLDWTINRWNSFHAGYNTHSERRRLFSQDKSIPAFLSFQRQDTKVQPSKWAIPDNGTAQEAFSNAWNSASTKSSF